MSQYSIRPARDGDVPWMVEELRKFSDAYSTRRKLFTDPETVTSLIGATIANHYAIVAERDKELAGMLTATYQPHPWNPDITILFETIWWVAESHRGQGVGHMLYKEFTKTGKRIADWTILTHRGEANISGKTFLRDGYVLSDVAYRLEA